MNFDLDPATLAAQGRARAFAATVTGAPAAAIDHEARVPADLMRQAFAAMPPATDVSAWVVALEELAVSSGALAVQVAGDQLDPGGDPIASSPWSGLRGADLDRFRARLADAPQWDLAVSAVLVGLGRAALETALMALRVARAAGGKPEQENWTIADAAAALDAARLLTWRAASMIGAEPLAAQAAMGMARLRAVSAAQLAVSASRHALDVDVNRPGALFERLGRDVDTAGTVCANPQRLEASVAAGVLPA